MERVCDRVAGGNKTTNARVFKDIMGEDFEYLPFRQRTMDLFDEYVAEHGIDIKDHVAETLGFLKDRDVRIASSHIHRQRTGDAETFRCWYS